MKFFINAFCTFMYSPFTHFTTTFYVTFTIFATGFLKNEVIKRYMHIII